MDTIVCNKRESKISHLQRVTLGALRQKPDKDTCGACPQIDAATAVKILFDAAPEGTVEPTLKAMAFIEHDARTERIHIEGFRGTSAVPEPVPVGRICALGFDWLARRSKVDD